MKKKFLENGYKTKTKKTPVKFISEISYWEHVFLLGKTEIGATMATMLFRELKMGVFKNIIYLCNHISDTNYF